MRSMIQILLIILLTLALILGLSLAFGGGGDTVPEETQSAAVPVLETVTETEPEETLPPETEPAMDFSFVPRYYQTDYPYDKFGNGTISTSGCSVTCLAMVATYLTEHVYTPDQLAWHFASYGKNNIERMEYGNSQMQLPNVRTDNVQEALQALKEGKVVIAMMDDESIFTSTQHFIVLAGMTEDQKIVINDPLEKVHEPEETYIIDGYANGFEQHNIFRGFSGAWIYDKAEMPAEPFLYDASKPEQPENRYEGYTLTGEDEYMLASFLWAEALEEPQEVRQAIAEVILNRVVSPDFPNTVKDVIYKGEYSHLVNKMKRAGEFENELYFAVGSAMYGPYVLPENVYYFSKWQHSGDIWGEIGPYAFEFAR